MLAKAKPDHTSTSSAALAFESVTRRFGRRWALRGVSLAVAPGEIVGVLGHNGSGKSTLLRIGASALKPTSGRVCFSGRAAAELSDKGRSRVGLLAIQSGLYEDLTAWENLRFVSSMLGNAGAGIGEVLERVGLADFAQERIRGFSSGMQRRLSLGRILLQRPSILLFDEPYNSLDADGVALVNQVLRDACSKGASALVVVHDLQNAEGLFDRAITLSNGLFEGPAVSNRAVTDSPAQAVELRL